jgi:ParB/RepB/Spo0J family partition protein
MSTPESQAAPSAPAIPATYSFERVELAKLIPSPDNPRTLDPADPKLAELAESLRTLGQIEPIVVRAIEHPDCYAMILAGERRWRAARLAGLADIECKVLVCDDRTALEITVVENLQRSDLSPMEEARGVRALLDAGWPTEEIAAHLGKSPAWVTLRARLTDLHAEWRDAIATDRSRWAWLGVAHLEQIARLPADTQIDLLRELRDHYEISAKELARFVEDRYLHLLAKAAWKLDDATLVPAAGSCTACPHRSAHQQSLFADVGAKDRCLLPSCWHSKAAALTLRKAAALREADKPVVVLGNDREAEAPASLPAGVTMLSGRAIGIKEVPKSTPGAVAAISVETGRQTWVAPETWAPAEVKKALGQAIKAPPATRAKAAPTGATAAKAAAMRAAKRFALRLENIAAAKGRAACPPLPDLLRLLAVLVQARSPVRQADTWAEIASTKRSEADDRDMLWEWVRDQLPHEYERVVSTQLPDLEAVQAMEGLVGIDPTEAGEAALRAVPEPEPKATAKAKAERREKPGSGAVPKPKPKSKKIKAAKAKKPAKKRGAA